MSRIFLKLIRVGNEEILGYIEDNSSSSHFVIHKPLRLIEADNQVILAPWNPFNTSNTIHLKKEAILYGPCEVIEELKDLYELFLEYFNINPDMRYGQFICKLSLKNLQATVEHFKHKLTEGGKEENEKPEPPTHFTAGTVTAEELEKMVEDVFDAPSKDKLN